MLVARNALVRVWSFGEFRVEYRAYDGSWKPVEPQEWGGNAHSRHVLRYLLLYGRRAGRGTLMNALWPDSDSLYLDEYLSKAISNLRKVFRTENSDDLVRTKNERTLYELADQSVIWTDMDACEAAMQEAERLGYTSAEGCRLLETAQTYFARGRLFEGEDGLWCHAKRDMFETAHYRCLLFLAEAYEAQGNLRHAEAQIEKLLLKNPLDETALMRLLILLHKQGMVTEAIRRYQSTAHLFATQGMSLSPSLKTFVQRLKDELHLPEIVPLRTYPAQPKSLLSSDPKPASGFSPPVAQTIIGETCLAEGDFMDQLRRKILKEAGVALFASQDLEFGAELSERLARALKRTSFIEEKTLSYLEKRIANYWQDRNDVSLPSSALVAYVLDDLQRVTSLLEGSLTPTMRIRLCSIVGMAAMLVGELYYDMKRYSQTRIFQNIAITAAHEADNGILEAVAWGRNSFAWTYDENFEEARNAIQRARRLAQGGNKIVRTWLAAVEAEIQSNRSDHEACLQALKEAALVENWNTPPDDCYWIHFDPSLLAGYQGICFLKLSNQGHKDLVHNAQTALEEALCLLAPSMKRRQPTLFIDLAGTYVQQEDIEQACVYAIQAVDTLKSINSKVVLQRLLALRGTLAPWKETCYVQELDASIKPLLTPGKYEE